MKLKDFEPYFKKISKLVTSEKDELVKLDQEFGDGDLGITMDAGFSAIEKYVHDCETEDLGKFFLGISKIFNEAAPSSLGTIISFFFMGMAKSLKGNSDASFQNLKTAFEKGVELIENKADSKVGDKTILDALVPAVEAFKQCDDEKKCLKVAFEASKNGMIATKNLVAVHGRAAYHKEKTLGHIDGGAYLAYIVFKAIADD